MPAVLSKVRDDVARACSKIPTPAVYGLGVATIGLVGYRILAASSKGAKAARKPTSNGKHMNNNYEKVLVEKCKTPTTCSAKLEADRCNICLGNVEYENNQAPSDSDDESPKILRTLGARVPGLNREFIKQILTLVKIMVPKLYCKETALLTVHTMCLFTRTFLSIYVASMEGSIVKYIVKKDVNNFMLMLLKWFGIAIPATFINSMIRYLENRLALAFR